MMKLLDAAFAHPRGLPGLLGGTIMARATRLRNQWTLSLLNIQPDEHILEVGFGPGAMIQELAAKAPQGEVAGVDMSPLMLKQASKRNADAIREGRVRLRTGSALELPFEDATFDKALSANSVHIWPDRLAGLKEMYRVLKPGGEIAIIVQPVWARTDDEVKAIGKDLVELLTKVGFQHIRLEFKPMKPKSSVCTLGIK
jgi:ubiquinone/menaquinone biosynthesis C-methylase UbiE